ncbi:MAG: ATP-dependent sacrificial sulfur transferase LarE [Firmicutes bacterium]|nr:ATP-dependent sacrificial sulfur transferase LarE [Bacillota bacterium]
MNSAREKYDKLIEILKGMESVAVAYSGGVDSSFLLAAAKVALGGKAVAVTAKSQVSPEREGKEAAELAAKLGAEHIILMSDEMQDENFVTNPPDRCYHCKKECFTKILNLAAEKGLRYVAEGSVNDDKNDYRPGMRAVAELGIRSPLLEADLTKDEVRILSREMELPTWNKAANPCLASRLPYGTRITPHSLKIIDEAEEIIRGMGALNVRVRIHDKTARIEVDRSFFPEIIKENNLTPIINYLKKAGFIYVTLDLSGYKTGSLNAMIGKEPVGEQRSHTKDS